MLLQADWITADHSRIVMDALDGQGFFVGGCVRNTLLGMPAADIDIATPLEPKEVLDRLRAADVKAIPTGLQHGTVTAVHQGAPVEITTFRTDVETDGRHAVVAFTREISEDAARRDFTMNALYADRTGEVIDPLGGLPDLHARRVRFIGSAHDRIREDYLRILRFFRFHAWYGADGLDADGLAACAELADGIDGLARERIGWELRKLLSAPDPAPAVASMAQAGILTRCLEGADASALTVLVHLEDESQIAPDWQRRLAVLGGQDVSQALRLSRTEERNVQNILRAIEAGESDRVSAYRFGSEVARSAALVRAASTGTPPPQSLQSDLRIGAEARFPLKAKHLMAHGIEPGPKVGELLQQAEAMWIESDFGLDREALVDAVLN